MLRGQALAGQYKSIFMKDAGKLMRAAFLGLLLILGFFATGCGGASGGDGGKMLTIADIGWTENTAIAQLTKVLLEEQLGYEEVTVKTSELESVYDGVAKGDLDAWTPSRTCGCPTSANCSQASRTTSSNLPSLTKARPNRA